jgi:hypothetical protein
MDPEKRTPDQDENVMAAAFGCGAALLIAALALLDWLL